MSKLTPIPIRFDADVKAALERVAAADHRSVASLIRIAVAEWLRERGHLKRLEQ